MDNHYYTIYHDIYSILYLMPFVLSTPVGIFWFVYLACKIVACKKFYRNAIKYSSEYSAYYDGQVAYHYRTEYIKYILLFVIQLSEALAVLGFILNITLVNIYKETELPNNNTYFTKTIKPCDEIYRAYLKVSKSHNPNFAILNAYEVYRILPFAFSDSFFSFILACIIFLCDYLISRHYSRPEILRYPKIAFIFFTLFLAVLVILGSNPYTAMLQMVLYLIHCYILYIVVLLKVRNLSRMLKQKYMEAISQDYDYKISNALMFQHKRFKLFSFVLLFGVFFAISANVLKYLEILAFTFLYTGKCWFNALYNIDYHPPLSDGNLDILLKVNMSRNICLTIISYIATYSIAIPYIAVSYIFIIKTFYIRVKGKLLVQTHFRNPLLQDLKPTQSFKD